jgi:hypothetical protein
VSVTEPHLHFGIPGSCPYDDHSSLMGVQGPAYWDLDAFTELEPIPSSQEAAHLQATSGDEDEVMLRGVGEEKGLDVVLALYITKPGHIVGCLNKMLEDMLSLWRTSGLGRSSERVSRCILSIMWARWTSF